MNLDKVSLTAEDHVRVSNIAMGKEERYNVPYTFKPKWDIDIFDTPEEKNATHQVKIA
jgi:L-glyceraldehyde reductase